MEIIKKNLKRDLQKKKKIVNTDILLDFLKNFFKVKMKIIFITP